MMSSRYTRQSWFWWPVMCYPLRVGKGIGNFLAQAAYVKIRSDRFRRWKLSSLYWRLPFLCDENRTQGRGWWNIGTYPICRECPLCLVGDTDHQWFFRSIYGSRPLLAISAFQMRQVSLVLPIWASSMGSWMALWFFCFSISHIWFWTSCLWIWG